MSRSRKPDPLVAILDEVVPLLVASLDLADADRRWFYDEVAGACRRVRAADRRATREAIRATLGDYSPSCMELALACVGRRCR